MPDPFEEPYVYPGGNAIVTNPPPQGQQPSTYVPDIPITAGPPTPQAGQAGFYPAVGDPQYDIYKLNETLRAAGYDGWQALGTPVEVVETRVDPTLGTSTTVSSGNYVVNIRKGDQTKRITFHKTWKNPQGQATTTDPGTPGAPYEFQPDKIDDQEKPDPNKVGHSGQIKIGDTLYGTNNATGNFEPVPNAPKIPQDVVGWKDLRQVDNPDGSKTWWGIDPSDGKPKKAPGMPEVPASASGWGNPTLIKQADGSQVWYGIDPTDKTPKPIPGAAPIKAGPAGPESIPQGGVTYIKKADGTYGPAPGVPDPNPTVGTPQIKLGDDGYLYQYTYAGNGRWDFDSSFKSVPYTDAAKQSSAQVGAMRKPGEPGEKVINGMVYKVKYRGGSEDQYDFDTSVPAKPFPGAIKPESITTTNEPEFIVQRMPDGSIQNVKNPNWNPSDTAGKVRHLQQQANDKLSELSAKVNGQSYTQEQAQADFDKWWEQVLKPQQQLLQLAQQKEIQELQTKQTTEQRAVEEQRRASYATAQTAGKNAVDAYTAMAPYRVGPGFGDAMNSLYTSFATGKMPQQIDFGKAFTYQIPDLNQLSQNAVAQALQHISPTAAQMTQGAGATPQALNQIQGMDMNGLFNKSNFQFGGGLPPNPNQNQGTQTTVSPSGAVTVTNTGEAPAQQAAPAWQRADQMFGTTPPGNAQAPMPGVAGTVPPNSPMYLGNYQFQGG